MKRQAPIDRLSNSVRCILLALIITISAPLGLAAKETKSFSSTTATQTQTTAVTEVIRSTGNESKPQIFPVGYKVDSNEYEFKDQKAPYKIAIWYPSAKPAGQHIYKIGPSSISADLAVDAPVAEGRFPIIFYSHGATGSGTSSFFICEMLARNGYIVVAPDFLDMVNAARIDDPVPFNAIMRMNTTHYIYWLREYGLNKASGEGRTIYNYRPEQLQSTMKKALAWDQDSNSIFHNHVDSDRIGLFGHSFGAWTSLLVSGASAKYYDKNVKAVVALSGPVNDFVFKVEGDNDLKHIKIPVLFEYGELEPSLGRRDDKSLLFEPANSPKMLLAIKNADHLSFSGGVKGEHKLSAEYLEQDPPRKTISETTLDFFDGFLKNDKKKLERLETRTDGISFSAVQF
jgi:predicted dienelactone hydrolase